MKISIKGKESEEIHTDDSEINLGCKAPVSEKNSLGLNRLKSKYALDSSSLFESCRAAVDLMKIGSEGAANVFTAEFRSVFMSSIRKAYPDATFTTDTLEYLEKVFFDKVSYFTMCFINDVAYNVSPINLKLILMRITSNVCDVIDYHIDIDVVENLIDDFIEIFS